MNRDGERWALVLSDGKPGHENQSLGVVPEGVEPRTFRIEYRSKWARRRAWAAARVPALRPLLAGQFPWPGLIGHGDRLADLTTDPPALVLSSGSGPAPLTLMLAEHLGRPAVTCMTPSVGLSRFDLALVPRHDNPPPSPNIVTTVGAPNLVNPHTLERDGAAFRNRHGLGDGPYLALLLGGDSAHYAIGPETGRAILDACLVLAQRLGMKVLVTTSRRTPQATEAAMAERAAECAYFCMGRTDPERVVPGMLASAAVAVVTEDSVSMVSESASSGARVLAVGVERKGDRPPRRHESVLTALADDGYVVRTHAPDLVDDGLALADVPAPPLLDDSGRCRAAVARLIGMTP